MPPGRRSMLAAITAKPLGPHQRCMRSGSVNACHTSSRGASNMRVMMNSEPAPSAAAVLQVAAFVAVISLPLKSEVEAMSAFAAGSLQAQIGSWLLVCLLHAFHIEFVHLQHCFHDPVRLFSFGTVQQLAQIGRNDLPGHAVFVCSPAALLFFSALG